MPQFDWIRDFDPQEPRSLFCYVEFGKDRDGHFYPFGIQGSFSLLSDAEKSARNMFKSFPVIERAEIWEFVNGSFTFRKTNAREEE